MMMFDNSWDAVFRPDLATTFFDGPRRLALRADRDGFDAVDAWWLAEMARLVYRMGPDETGRPDRARTRNDILRDVGFTETVFVNVGGSQASVITPLAAGADHVVVVFRGSDDIQAWLDFNAALALTSWPEGGKVHAGFKAAFDHVWPGLVTHLPPDRRRVFTGHSLGGALAVLAASRSRPSCTYTFGAPRIGDARFAETIDEASVRRVVNHTDLVTDLPLGLIHGGRLAYIGHDGLVRPMPSDRAILHDRLRPDPTYNVRRLLESRVAAAPQPLADHAPVNYVAHLARAASAPAAPAATAPEG